MSNYQQFPFISVIVISKDRHHLLQEAVESLKNMDYPKEWYEIVIIEEGDVPLPIPETKYFFIQRKNLGLGYARNLGVNHSKGDIILFTDDDCVVDKDWAKLMVQTIINENVGGVAGSTLSRKSNVVGICEEIMGFPGGGLKRFLKSKGKVVLTKYLSGCNCGYDRKVFKEIKFEEKGYGALGADDYMMGIQVSDKFGCCYNPDAIVWHKPRGNLLDIIKWFERRKINDFLVKEKFAGLKSFYTFIKEWRLIVSFRIMALIILVFAGKATATFAGVLILLYFLILYFRHYPMIKFRKKFSVLIVLPFVKVCMDIGVLKAEIKYIFCSYKSLLNTLSEYSR